MPETWKDLPAEVWEREGWGPIELAWGNGGGFCTQPAPGTGFAYVGEKMVCPYAPSPYNVSDPGNFYTTYRWTGRQSGFGWSKTVRLVYQSEPGVNLPLEQVKWQVFDACAEGYYWDEEAGACVPYSIDEEDMPLGEFTSAAADLVRPGEETYFVTNHSEENPVRLGFNRDLEQLEVVASVLPTFPLHSELFTEVPPVAPLKLDDTELPGNYRIRGEEGAALVRLTVTENGAVPLSAVVELNDNVVQVGHDLTRVAYGLDRQVEWSNQMNKALAERIDALARLVDVLGTRLCGEGWYDQWKASEGI